MINVLPDSYCTPLYFTEDEIKLLKGSPVQSKLLSPLAQVGLSPISGKVQLSIALFCFKNLNNILLRDYSLENMFNLYIM